MANPLFSTIPAPKVPRNTFPLTHNNKLTLTAQKLVPTWIKEGLPGDLNKVFLECMCRAMPMVAPVFQNYTISHHCFWVPMRTLHKHWQDFLYGGKNGDYNKKMPYTSLGAFYTYIQTAYTGIEFNTDRDSFEVAKKLCAVIKMLDYAGLPFKTYSTAGVVAYDPDAEVTSYAYGSFISAFLNDEWNMSLSTSSEPINLLPFLAMLKVWSEYYRDENLVDDPMDIFVGDDSSYHLDEVVGAFSLDEFLVNDFCELFMLRPRAWKKDRFTSALPFAQRGPEVLMPITGTVPVDNKVTIPESGAGSGFSITTLRRDTDGKWNLAASGAGSNYQLGTLGEVDFDNAELTTTINNFRTAERLQRWYENNARGGYRSNEAQPAHWGVYTKDATLQRAVFLGGQRQPLVISEIDQTSQTTSSSPQGNLAGKGSSYNSGNLFRQFADENGFTLVFTSILQNADYWQGIPKVFTRSERTEYAWPEFAHLGEEPIFTKELFADAPSDEVFGYTPRYSDYKSVYSEVHADMRSSLESWSVPRVFGDKPALNEEFIYNPPQKVAFAVEDGVVDEFLMVIRFSGKGSRLLPFYGVPTI